MSSKMSIFRLSKAMNFVQNFIQSLNFRLDCVHLLKGIWFACGQILTDFQVCKKKCSISLYYGGVGFIERLENI